MTAEYLLEIFCDLTELTANITPGYLLDWQKLIGINLTSWEAETILRMFSSYMIELRKKGGSDPLEEYSEKEVRMANTIRGFLSGRG